MKPTAQAMTKVWLVNNGNGSIGSVARCSTKMKPASATTVTAIIPRMIGEFKAKLCPPRLVKRRSEEHTTELQSLMRSSYAVFCLKKKKKEKKIMHNSKVV